MIRFQPDPVDMYEVRVTNPVIAVDLFYPPYEDDRPSENRHCHTVQVGMLHVRAADDIQIRYDFKRDGWSIRQASRFAWAIEDKVMDRDWQEVAFVQAWARENDPPEFQL